MADNTCACCGAIIPEGRQICLLCEGENEVQHFHPQIAPVRWIPCSERLPDSREGIIFTVDRGHPFVCAGYRINNERKGLQRWFDKLSGLNFSDYDVKAWMPMPDAYKPPEKE